MSAAAAKVVNLDPPPAPTSVDGGGGGDSRDRLVSSLLDVLAKLAAGRRASHIAAREKTALMSKVAAAVKAAAATKSKTERRNALAEIASVLDSEVADWCAAEHAFANWTAALREVARHIDGFPVEIILADKGASAP